MSQTNYWASALQGNYTLSFAAADAIVNCPMYSREEQAQRAAAGDGQATPCLAAAHSELAGHHDLEHGAGVHASMQATMVI